MAIVVSDLSGLTKTTRKYGVLQTASNIARMRQIALPVLNRLGICDFCTEGDNLIMTFRDLGSAAQAAFELQQRWRDYDAGLPAERAHFKINVSGFAIGWGTAVRHGNHMVGTGFQRCYHLAEDEAEAGQILVGPVAQKLLSSELPGASLKPAQGDLFELVPSAAMKELHSRQGSLAAFDDEGFLHPNLVMLAKRHAPDADLAALDAELRRRVVKEGMAAVLVRYSEQAQQAEKDKAGEHIQTCFLKTPGVVKYEEIHVESDPDLTFFDTAADALVAVMTASKICDSAVVTGWGIHQGEVLLVPHTDVHWGDPVNTASKIGQDLAEPGEKLISHEVYQGLPSSLRSEYHFTERTVEASGVKQRVWRVEHQSN